MKNFIINFFRNYPVCTGLLALLIGFHIVGIKDLRTPIVLMEQTLFPVLFFYVMTMLCYMMFVLPKISPQKREKITWIVVASMVVILTIGTKFFIV